MPFDSKTPVDDVAGDVAAAFAEVQAKSSEAEQVETAKPDSGEVGADKGSKPAVRQAPPKDASGRFAKRTSEASGKAVEAGKTEGQEDEGEVDTEAQAPQDKAEKPVQAAVAPPSSWSVKSKAAWDRLPEEVRADIVKREAETAQGLAALRDYKDLKPYAELASKHNTTIKDYVDRTLKIENLLRQDLGAGIAVILQNYGLRQDQAAQFFMGLAQKYGAQPAAAVPGAQARPGQMKPGDPLYDVLKPFLEPLQQEIQTLRQSQSSREEADRNASQQSLAQAIETFASDPANRYFPELMETMTSLMSSGVVPRSGNHAADLKTAYEQAAYLVPEVREALIEQRLHEQKETERRKEQEAAAKARKASGSLTGSRVPATAIASQQTFTNGHDDIEADVRAAYNLHSQH